MYDFSPFTVPTADWLDVTYSLDDNPADLLSDFLVAHNFVSIPSKSEHDSSYRYLCPETLETSYGVLRVTRKHGAYRISASGTVLGDIRRLGAYDQYFTLLASSPYRVTRLDAALDVNKDAALILASLDTKFSRGVSLGRQRPLSTNLLIGRRPDGLRSGTWYAGHRSYARVTARVYDKTLELSSRHGLDLADMFTRYELTFRKGLASLNDAYAPTGIFWAHASALLSPPNPVREWEPSDTPSWVSTPVEVLPYQALLRRVSNSPELDAMLELADRMGSEGRAAFLHMIAKKCQVDVKSLPFRSTA